MAPNFQMAASQMSFLVWAADFFSGGHIHSHRRRNHLALRTHDHTGGMYIFQHHVVKARGAHAALAENKTLAKGPICLLEIGEQDELT